ncbi:MAG: indolepyruvate oxidoreductase subunit beta [Candidatus Aenigmatarchaeota archaeon]
MRFNLVVIGYGGQGVLSLAEIIGRAAVEEGHDVKSTEVHGLSQRGGALQCHVRFGDKIFSPLVRKAGANLIIALDVLEAWRACYYANKNTTILTDKKLLHPRPILEKYLDAGSILKEIKKFAKVEVVNASKIVESLTGEDAMSNIFMLGYAINKRLLPLKKENAWKAVAKKIRPEFLELNKKVFEEAFKM